MTHWARTILCAAATAMMVACNPQTAYHQYLPMPEDGWAKNQILYYNAQVADSNAVYRVDVEVRTLYSYPYQNMALSIQRFLPNDSVAPPDSIQFLLTPPTKAWRQNSGSSLVKTVHTAGILQIDTPGLYRFRVSSLLPDSKLKGIKDIGLRLVRLQQPPVTAGIDADKDKQQDGEAPQRGAAVTEEREGNADNGGNAQHHPNVDKHVK